ncbi:MAG: accessory factor UbiK family protein [Pseudomonadota bacterium]
MPQSNNRLFDELAKFLNDAAGAAQGARDELETVMRTQGEKIVAQMDLVTREEFEIAKEMAEQARLENEALKARIAALEVRMGMQSGAIPDEA